MACKGFVITDANFINKKHDLKKAAAISSGGIDLGGKIEFYLKNKILREKMAKNGYNYVIKNANMDKEIHKLVKIIKDTIKH
ncbi:MAG: glycosyltransferase family 1 protein [Crenarchaeota archaeon]|nr:glycosyltransferase family 1 protein [Thermoproteota archaeon]